jgi:cell fate (sporulation/competence/biofilm development) regulator YlbF (YheA/YmcA/DUF963 family)
MHCHKFVSHILVTVRVLAIAFGCGMWFISRDKFMPTKIETKTNELCEAILEQLQTNGIRKRIDTFLADAGTRGQYETLMSKGQALQEKQHHGQPLEPAEISAFEKDRETLLKNPVASGFLDAQEEMHHLQSSVQKVVAKTIELGRLPVAADLEEDSCGHGCGCHH